MKPDSGTDATLTPSQAPTSSEAPSGARDPEGARAAQIPEESYRVGAVLGKGGMGEVVAARDLRMGREVAIKRMRADRANADTVARFLREARIQARLDHPAIVPVHELGYDEAGRPYFTMKRLAGRTLHHVLDEGHATQQKLLRAFVEVCLAIDFAHARGVIHRDLKPSNIMLGDYGEVYVLDWGVARVDDKDEQDRFGEPEGKIESLDGHTQAGAILGTPGYMSPEQVKGDPVTAATDVYALGSILFEILAGQPAHPTGAAGLASTVQMPTVSPAQRVAVRGIAPELDAICVAALDAAPDRRPTARELADRIQQFLDGDRDVARRRKLALEQLAIAKRALETADPARRAEAMNAAGRALALDPESKEAANLVAQLVIEAPPKLPAALAQKLRDAELDMARKQARVAAASLVILCAFLPLVMWVGIRDWTPVLVGFTASALMAAFAPAMARRPERIIFAVLANGLMIVMLSRLFGPFVIVPGLALAAAVGLISFPTLLERPWVVLGTMLLAMYAPLVLEEAGVWASTWSLVDGTLVTRPTAIDFDGGPALVLLLLAHTALVVVMALFVRSLAAAQRQAQRRLEIQAWHLEQLLPTS